MHLGSWYIWWMLAVKSRILVLKCYIMPPILSLQLQEHFLEYVGEHLIIINEFMLNLQMVSACFHIASTY